MANNEFKKINNVEEYKELFNNADKKETLKQILDIRKFEIELYWKRATYYWTMIGAILAGYLITYSNMRVGEFNKLKIIFFLNCLGLIFTIAWYFVNRGSKYWQLNWEKQLESLEDDLIGPLYKTIISRDHYFKKFWELTAPFPFSVSKINQILNVILIVFWVLIFGFFSHEYLKINLFILGNYFSFYSAFGFITVLAIISLYFFSHTGKSISWIKTTKKTETSASFEKRGIK